VDSSEEEDFKEESESESESSDEFKFKDEPVIASPAKRSIRVRQTKKKNYVVDLDDSDEFNDSE